MSRVKATASLTIYKIFKKRDPERARRFLAELSLPTRQMLQMAGPGTWIPMQQQIEILETASRIFYPGDPSGFRSLGYEVAKDNFSGIYRIFLRFPKLEAVIKSLPTTWHTIHDEGQVAIENLTAKSGTVVVKGMPDLPASEREYVCGLTAAVLELIGRKQVSIMKDERDPNAWKWHIHIE